jgi:hypothetical protein
VIIHSIAPWFLARYQPNLERTARNSLARAGFECWYPTYLDIRPTPLRKISPSKRRLAHLFVQQIRRPRFVGYILARPLPWCRHDLNRLFELPGCGAVVTLGGKAAKVEDFDVEIMRVAEVRGTFDTWVGVGPKGRFRVSPAAVDQRWIAQGKKLLAVDEARKLHLAADALGRIGRLVDEANGTAFAPEAKARRDHGIIHVKPNGIAPGGMKKIFFGHSRGPARRFVQKQIGFQAKRRHPKWAEEDQNQCRLNCGL